MDEDQRKEYVRWYRIKYKTSPDEDDLEGEAPKDPVSAPDTALAVNKTCLHLLNHWADLFEKHHGRPYDPGDQPEKIEAVSVLLHKLCGGDHRRAHKSMTFMFKHPKLSWLTDISLMWPARVAPGQIETNFDRFILPLLSGGSRTKKGPQIDRPRSGGHTFRPRSR